MQESSGEGSPESVDQSEEFRPEPKSFEAPSPLSGSVFPALLLLFAWTVLADWLLYCTLGFSGPAAFIALAPVLIGLIRCVLRVADASSGPLRLMILLISVMVLACSASLVWSGNVLALVSGIVLIGAFSLVSVGCFPWALESIASPFRALIDGIAWMIQQANRRKRKNRQQESSLVQSLRWLLPLVAILGFGSIFVLANPDMRDWFSGEFVFVWNQTIQWVMEIDAMEVPFCIVLFFIGGGLFFPALSRRLIGGRDAEITEGTTSDSVLLPAFRNTLIAVIALFSLYLVFEAVTLWKRDFPPGFYYAGYAHEGAAWLTVALALATAVLSFMFRGATFRDSRLPSLKLLAWVWAALNYILALAVYHRLTIYIGYNGLTTMRVVGLFGTTAVVLGFTMVVIKIRRHFGFWWLIRSQLTSLGLCVIVYSIFPVDYVVHRYNTARVLVGDPRPSVMIAVKEKDDSGYLPLIALIDCRDRVIRNGVRAMLAEHQLAATAEVDEGPWNWTRYQLSTDLLIRSMSERQSKWQVYLDDPILRHREIQRFQDYAMQWY